MSNVLLAGPFFLYVGVRIFIYMGWFVLCLYSFFFLVIMFFYGLDYVTEIWMCEIIKGGGMNLVSLGCTCVKCVSNMFL